MTAHSDLHDDMPDDTPDLAALIQEIPRLMRVRAFGQTIAAGSYFSRLGEPLTSSERVLAQRYLDGLGFPDVTPAGLETWEDASEAALALDHDATEWEAEQMMHAGLAGDALDRVEEEGLNTVLAYIANQVTQAAKPNLDDAAAMWSRADRAVVNAALGGAVRAAHGAALALVVDDSLEEASAHPFAARHHLFLHGRWVVGLAGLTLNVF